MLLEHSMLKPHSLISKINTRFRIFEFMYVCLYVCTHVVIWRYVYTYNYIYIFVCMYVCMYVYVCIYVSIHACVCVCTTICMHIYTFIYAKTIIDIHMIHSHLYTLYVCMHVREVLICFKVWAKLAQQWLVCAPFAIHLEPINKETM